MNRKRSIDMAADAVSLCVPLVSSGDKKYRDVNRLLKYLPRYGLRQAFGLGLR